MADPKGAGPWRRFLALPSDSRPKTIAMAFAVSSVCAILVSAATGEGTEDLGQAVMRELERLDEGEL